MSPYGRMLLGLAWPLIATASAAVVLLPLASPGVAADPDGDALIGIATRIADSGPLGLLSLAVMLAVLAHGVRRYLRWERGDAASCPRCTMLLGRRRGSGPVRRRCLGCGHRVIERRAIDRPSDGLAR